MSESKFNKQVQDLIESAGGYIVKTIVSNKAGTHDMLACIPDSKRIGRFVSLEGKLPYNQMSHLQLACRNSVIRAGGLALEVKTLQDVRKVIRWVKLGKIQTVEEEPRQLKEFDL